MSVTAELLTLPDFERAASERLDPPTWAYLAGGAGSERTVAANCDAYGELWLVPRILAPPRTALDTSIRLLGQRLSIPVLVGPTSPQRLFHEEAEIAVARAAASAGTVAVVSSDSHYAFDQVSAAAPGSCWFQLYAYRSAAHVDAAIDLALSAGAGAIVVTVDAEHPARRIRAARAGFASPSFLDFGTLRRLGVVNGSAPTSARVDRLPLSWRELERIRTRTSGPLLVKGVLRPEDARECVAAGADGVIVSNHGGRQLDGALPSLSALAGVAAAVDDGTAVLVDGGIRSGGDVIKALALGADAVLLGRPPLWGLAVGGQAGVEAVLQIIRDELEDALRQLGLEGVGSVGADCLASGAIAPAPPARFEPKGAS